MKKIKFVAFLIIVPFFSIAQKSEIGTWYIYTGNQKINNKWNWHNEAQFRYYNFIGDLQQLLLRTGIGYNLTDNNNNVLLGYAFVNSQNYVDDSDEKVGTNENRIFEQFITRQNFGRISIQHRYRVEERFLQENFQMRFRYHLSIIIPINNNTLTGKTFYASVYNELFLNGESPVFDRNRVYGGVGYVINKNFRVEAGFMTQLVETTNRNQFQLAFINNVSFSKN